LPRGSFEVLALEAVRRKGGAKKGKKSLRKNSCLKELGNG